MTEIVKTFKTLTEDEFYAQFNPVKNHIDEDCSFDGCMYETYGRDINYINAVAKDPVAKLKLWTIIEAEGKMFYVSGYHYVNRFGYIITEESVPENIEYDVELDTEVDSNETGPFDQLGYEQTTEE
jgi:hypothetical protein